MVYETAGIRHTRIDVGGPSQRAVAEGEYPSVAQVNCVLDGDSAAPAEKVVERHPRVSLSGRRPTRGRATVPHLRRSFGKQFADIRHHGVQARLGLYLQCNDGSHVVDQRLGDLTAIASREGEPSVKYA